jgi:hypothetical protein
MVKRSILPVGRGDLVPTADARDMASFSRIRTGAVFHSVIPFWRERMTWGPKSLWQKWRAQRTSNHALRGTLVDPGGEREGDFGAFCAKQGLREPLSNVGSGYLGSGYFFREWAQGQGLLCHPELKPTSVERALRQAKSRAEHAFKRCGASMSPPMLVVAFPNQELLWAATESLIGESYGPSQARFFSDPFPHLFAALIGARDERVLVHNLRTLSLVGIACHAGDEGLALLAEEAVFGAPELVRGGSRMGSTEY